MGSCKFTALVFLFLSLFLLPGPASPRVLQEKPSSNEAAPAPAVTADKPRKSDSSKGAGQSSSTVPNPENKKRLETPPLAAPVSDNQTSSVDPGKKKSALSPPPSSDAVESTGQATPPLVPNVAKGSPRPGGPGPSAGDEAGETGSVGRKGNPKDKRKEVEKCDDGSKTCRIGEELFACLQVSQSASIGSFVIVQYKGQSDITVDVKPSSNIDVHENEMKLHFAKDGSEKVNIVYSNPNGGEITLTAGNGTCTLSIGQPVSDWQQHFQQFAAYATHLNPMYGAYFFVFTVVLVGVVWASCKFARKSDGGVPYQQLEMRAQAPSSAGADNTTSTADGWGDGWDDDWDDEAVARSSDRKPAESVSANGLSLRPQNNNKDGWDVDWDD